MTDVREPERILVIRLSALGDFIMALPAMAAIRRRHPDADIALLTTKPLAELGKRSGWFNRVEIDPRPGWRDLTAWLALRRWLRTGRFDRVYDLQSQDRTALYFRLFWPGRPEWSGIAPGASHRHTDPARGGMHAFDIHAAQLALSGIADIPAPDLTWLDEDTRKLGLPSRIALLVPGSAPHRPAKRWPAAQYGALARILVEKRITPVIIGTADEEKPLAEAIRAICPKARDLTGQTSLFAIAGLARRAQFAIGSDTGPMHLIAMVGCKVISLFSAESNPARSAPRGRVTVLHRPDLTDLSVDTVVEAIANAE